ncbi:MAG: hypothetical protein ACI9N9_002367 [Enterobacterales bacterium]|jgi:hypothetical protein
MSALFDEDQQHYDPTTNELLIGGKVYIGDVNVNPIDNPKAVYSVRALTGAALAQPLIIGPDGRVETKGWTSGKYSYQINSSADVLKYQELDNGVDVQVGNSLTTNSLGVNDITVTGSPTITELVDGQAYVITVPANNTGNVTLKIDTTPVTSVRKNYDEQLVADDLKADQKLILLYNGTDSRFEAQILTKSPGIDDQATAHRVTITDTEITTDVPILDPSGNVRGGRKNAIINGNFGINQRAVSGTVTLAAGAYGHDRWKGGASGCTYTFATADNVTTVTISAGSLIQVVEGLNFFSGTYTLSFVGTAQGKIGGGSFADSGVTGSATGGTDLNIEVNSGTISKIQLETGSVATEFEPRSVGEELALCQRYYEISDNRNVFSGDATNTSFYRMSVIFATNKRAAPTMVTTSIAASGFPATSPTTEGVSPEGFSARATANTTAVASYYMFSWTADAEL